MMEDRIKLYNKCANRVGMKVYESTTGRSGKIHSFAILNNPDGTFSVNYTVAFKLGESEAIRLESIHESKLVLFLGNVK